MKIYRAIKTTNITQKFGLLGTAPQLLPFYQSMGLQGHNGYDFLSYDGEPIYWDGDIRGIVLNTEMDNKGGLGINVITEDKDGIFKHRFWHLKEFKCQAGQILESGDLIGLADNTGYSSANHLHRDLKPMIKDELGNYQKKEPDNGFAGCIDLFPYFINLFILDIISNLKVQISLTQKIIELFQKVLNYFKNVK